MSAPNNPLFGRKWSVKIYAPVANGQQQTYVISDSTTEPNSLRVTFDIQTQAWQAFWYADIVIYNPTEQLTNFLITQGPVSSAPPATNAGDQAPPIQQNMIVEVEAGYQGAGNYGTVWYGPILQPLFERENQTDFKVTLHCVIGLATLGRNDINKTYTDSNQQQIVAAIARDSFHPIGTPTNNQISTTLGAAKFIRSKVVFGNPKKFLTEIARDNNSQWWLDGKGLNISKVDDSLEASAAQAIVYTPSTGIIGTPQQTQFGISFRVLMDPRMEIKKPLICVNIQNTQIRQLLKQIGVLPSLLSQDGTYVVVGVRYTGDTRGNDWYTDVTGYLLAQDKLAARYGAMGEAQIGNG